MKDRRRRTSIAVAAAAVTLATTFGGLAAPPASADATPSVSLSLNQPLTVKNRTFKILSASTKADADGKFLVQFNFDAEAAGQDSYAIGPSTFRMRVGGQQEAPTSATTDVVEGHAHLPGTVSFVIPTTTKTATLVVYVTDHETKEVPLTFNAVASQGQPKDADPQQDSDDVEADDEERDDPVAGPKPSTGGAAPTIDLEGILGGVSVNVTDHSGVDSNCTYTAPLVSRQFHLPADGTASVKIVPLAQLGIPYNVSIVCDNGTRLDTTAVW